MYMDFDKNEFDGDNSELHRFWVELSKISNEMDNTKTDYSSDPEKYTEHNMDMGLLGEPHKSEVFDEDGFNIIIKYWDTPMGEVKNVEVECDKKDYKEELLKDKLDSIMRDDINQSIINESLPMKLNKAIEEEDYALAAKIRDKINSKE